MSYRNMTLYNGTIGPVRPGQAACGRDAYISSIVAVAVIHGLVVCGGLFTNMYMLSLLHSKKGRRKKLSDIDLYFSQLGICDICTILALPVWLTQSMLNGRWIFGYAMCKIFRATTTFFFQYGICLLVYVNVSKYLKIVHYKRVATKSRKNIGLVSALCAFIPAISAIVDIAYWNTIRLSPASTVVLCYNTMAPTAREVSLWFRMTVSFFLPIIVIVYCNSMIVYTVKKHIRDTRFGKHITRTYQRAKLLPMITVACFVCCWTPWVVSVLYFRSHKQCNVVTVLNICTAIGHLYCLSNPVLYILVNVKRNGELRVSTKSSCTSV